MSTFAVTGGHRHTAPKSGNTMHKWVISGGIALLIISAFLALASGPVLSDWRLAFAWWWPSTFDGISDLHLRIVFEIRIPRFMLGALVGCVLAQAGTAMQTLCRNPLADPGLIGVSSGAAVAALAVIALGGQIGLSGAGWVTAAAFAGALTATWLVYVIASGNNGTQVATLLLAGVAINALAGALIGLLSYHADDDALRLMTFWQMGSLAGASWPQLWVGCACLLFACLMLSLRRRAINVLLLGETQADYMGVNIHYLKREMVIWVALGVGAAVAMTGIIGFIGLVVPHIARLLIGADVRQLMPTAMLLGAVTLTLADWAARMLVAPAELPIGIITAAVGAPFFIALLIQQKRRSGSAI